LKTQVLKQGPAIILLLTVAAAFSGLGIFLDEEVIPSPPSSEHLLKEATAKASVDASAVAPAAPEQPSEIARQLKGAIDSANRQESDETEKLTQKISTSGEMISETNRLLEEKGVLPATDGASEKSEEFSRRLEELKTRLAKMQSSGK